MSDNVTMGVRSIPAMTCSDQQVRPILATIQQQMAVLGNPAPANQRFPPIAQDAYPWTIGVDFELITAFDDDGMATARTVQTDGNLSPPPETPTTPHPAGSPPVPAVIDICTWPGFHPNAIPGDRGHAVYRLLLDGTWCWWVIQIIDGPLQGPHIFEFEGNFDDDSGGPRATGGGTFTNHSPPNSGQHLCFTAGVADHWVDFGAGTATLNENGWSWSGWVKVPHASGTCVVIQKQKNGGGGGYGDAEWFVQSQNAGPNGNFLFLAEFFDSGGSSVGTTNIDSPAGSWQDTVWHFLVCVVEKIGTDEFRLGISVDGGAFDYSPTTTLTGTPADQTTGHLIANDTNNPPSPGEAGDETYCLDSWRFYTDRELSSDEITTLYNGGVIT